MQVIQGNTVKKEYDLPTVEQLESVIKDHHYKKRFWKVFFNTVIALVVIAAVSILLAMMFLPVLQINGSSMTGTLHNDDIVIAMSHSKCENEDVIAFYYNNSVLVKRVVATSGQWVDIDEEGNVYVDGALIEEKYVSEKALGDCNITLPYQVPDGKYFVMGDHRSTSIDSRNTAVGCVSEDMIVGKVVFRVWPMKDFGYIDK